MNGSIPVLINGMLRASPITINANVSASSVAKVSLSPNAFTDIMEYWDKAFNQFVLIENETTGTKQVCKFSEGFMLFTTAKRDKQSVKVTVLDQETAKVLYGQAKD